MALPPAILTVKRKRHEDPVEFLRIHESSTKPKRRLTTDFVFSRQIEPVETNSTSTSVSFLVAEQEQCRRIKSLPRSASSQLLRAKSRSTAQTQDEYSQAGRATPARNTLQPSSQSAVPITPVSQKQQPRKFHLSHSASTTPSSVISGRVQKPLTLFVERRTRAVNTSTENSSPSAPSSTRKTQHALNPAPAPVLKKPGHAARTAASPSRAAQLSSQTRDVRLPSGLIAPWSLDERQLVEEMQRYTLQEIGHSIAEAKAPETGRSPVATPNKRPLKFKPKVPKLRYHERHPEEFAKQDPQKVEEFIEDADDESDYIIDTYIRVPADVMELDANSETNFGFLVLDGQEEIDEFYSVEIDSDEDEEYDEEDENAENHYSADYPDEEVDSDDEYGRNPYQYTNEDVVAFSDDSDGGTKYSWANKPAWLRKSAIGSEGEDDEDN